MEMQVTTNAIMFAEFMLGLTVESFLDACHRSESMLHKAASAEHLPHPHQLALQMHQTKILVLSASSCGFCDGWSVVMDLVHSALHPCQMLGLSPPHLCGPSQLLYAALSLIVGADSVPLVQTHWLKLLEGLHWWLETVRKMAENCHSSGHWCVQAPYLATA